MTDQDLHELLERLRLQLEQAKSLDEKEREQLQRLNDDIDALLKRSEGQVNENLMRRLQDSIDYFEVAHPTLTRTLSEMMTILSNAGI